MKGVRFVMAVERWQVFYDACVARDRQAEPRETLDEVRKRLQGQGKLTRLG